MIILGIDPGTICTGFGIIKFEENHLARIHSGIIKPNPKKDISYRLNYFFDEIEKLISSYKPNHFSIETAFYGKNVQSVLKLGYIRGVSLLAAQRNKLIIGEYSPREVKKAVVGNGAASKNQVCYMIEKLMSFKKENIILDESDALAVAVCHAFNFNTKIKSGGSWKSFVNNNPNRISGN